MNENIIEGSRSRLGATKRTGETIHFHITSILSHFLPPPNKWKNNSLPKNIINRNINLWTGGGYFPFLALLLLYGDRSQEQAGTKLLIMDSLYTICCADSGLFSFLHMFCFWHCMLSPLQQQRSKEQTAVKNRQRVGGKNTSCSLTVPELP